MYVHVQYMVFITLIGTCAKVTLLERCPLWGVPLYIIHVHVHVDIQHMFVSLQVGEHTEIEEIKRTVTGSSTKVISRKLYVYVCMYYTLYMYNVHLCLQYSYCFGLLALIMYMYVIEIIALTEHIKLVESTFIPHSRWVGTYMYKNLNNFRREQDIGTGLVPIYSTHWSG